MAYITLFDKLKVQGIDPSSVDIDDLTQYIDNQGIKPVGYTYIDDRYLHLYDDSDSFDVTSFGLPATEAVREPKVSIEKIEKVAKKSEKKA